MAEAVVQAVEYDEPDIVVNFPNVRYAYAGMFAFPRAYENAIGVLRFLGLDAPLRFFRKDAIYEAGLRQQ